MTNVHIFFAHLKKLTVMSTWWFLTVGSSNWMMDPLLSTFLFYTNCSIRYVVLTLTVRYFEFT